jgi:hypothetical protein
MMWKVIAQSVTGTSHAATGRGCDDAHAWALQQADGEPFFIACASDGAGSASQSATAANTVVQFVVNYLGNMVSGQQLPTAAQLMAMAEEVHMMLAGMAAENNLPLYEYACTMLGCVVYPGGGAWFQIGDGAIVRSGDGGQYAAVWWPQNGEYLNTTAFITDDDYLSNLQVSVTSDSVAEVALLTDGLQLVALSMENSSAHQPFFRDMFRVLRMADTPDKVALLQEKLGSFLNSEPVNARTDDDKTLILATIL